jgi:hypothetical protein
MLYEGVTLFCYFFPLFHFPFFLSSLLRIFLRSFIFRFSVVFPLTSILFLHFLSLIISLIILSWSSFLAPSLSFFPRLLILIRNFISLFHSLLLTFFLSFFLEIPNIILFVILLSLFFSSLLRYFIPFFASTHIFWLSQERPEEQQISLAQRSVKSWRTWDNASAASTNECFVTCSASRCECCLSVTLGKSLLWRMWDFCLCTLLHSPYFIHRITVLRNLSHNICLTKHYI